MKQFNGTFILLLFLAGSFCQGQVTELPSDTQPATSTPDKSEQCQILVSSDTSREYYLIFNKYNTLPFLFVTSL